MRGATGYQEEPVVQMVPPVAEGAALAQNGAAPRFDRKILAVERIAAFDMQRSGKHKAMTVIFERADRLVLFEQERLAHQLLRLCNIEFHTHLPRINHPSF